MTIRSLFLKTHLYVGLTIGLVLVAVSLSGAVLVFEDDIDRALHADLAFVPPEHTRVPLDDLIAGVKHVLPAAQVGSMSFPEKPTHSIVFNVRANQESLAVYVNPYTGQILGTRTAAEREAGMARRIHLLHTRLFGGQAGEWVVGGITALTLLMAITGLILWWPGKTLTVKTSASWRRVNFDLHNVFGLYASVVFVFIALTGVMIAFESVTDPLVTRLNAAVLPSPPKESSAANGAVPLSADQLARAADNALAGAFLKSLSMPNGARAVAIAGMKYPEDRTPGGRSRVYLDQYSGAPLLVLSTRTAPLGTRIVNLKRSAHTGDIFGAPTRVLYFVTCLMLAGQVLTGFFIWWRRPAPARRN